MPRQPNFVDGRLENITNLFKPLIVVLHELNDAFGPAFIRPMSATLQALVDAAQRIKHNKSECVELMETTHKIIFEIVNLHIKSEVPGSLPVDTVDHVGRFIETLRKIYAYIEAQQDGNKIKQLFRLAEATALLKDCQAGLAQAIEGFQVSTASKLVNHSQELEGTLQEMHVELLKTIQESSDVLSYTSSVISSSNSFSLLPPTPNVFHGRETEVQMLIKLLEEEKSPRIAILGGGGMGKTCLARVVLHHPTTLAKFEHRFFVTAEAAISASDLAALVGLHIGLDPAPDLTKSVVRFFQKTANCLLVIDNLETVWDTAESQDSVEQFLSMLDDIDHLALIITMRGVERPKQVKWTHPFIAPLQPLSKDAALQTFKDITNGCDSIEQINEVLQYTDYMPLAVDLMANLVEYEGLSTISSRWKDERTSILALGYDRKSNLDISIGLSLSSSRVTSESKDLLSLLSILPNGLSDTELLQSQLPISHILKCRSVLLSTSLAYLDKHQRLKSLVPIREHVQQYMPPSRILIQAVQRYLHSVLQIYHNYNAEQHQSVMNQITYNLGNLQQILQPDLTAESSNIKTLIYCILYLNSFYRVTGRRSTSLMDKVEPILLQLNDKSISARFLIEDLHSFRHKWVISEQWVTEKTAHFHNLNNIDLETQFYINLGNYFMSRKPDLPQAQIYYQAALDLARSSGNTHHQSNSLIKIGMVMWRGGNYVDANTYVLKGQQVSQSSGNFYTEAQACYIRASILIDVGDYREAISQLQRSQHTINICGLSGGFLHYSIALHHADIHLRKSEYTQAQTIFRSVIENTSIEDNNHAHAVALLNSAYIDILKNTVTQDISQALHTSREIFDRLDRNGGMLTCDMVEAELNLKRGRVEWAKLRFKQILKVAWEQDVEAKSYCLERLGNPKLWPSSDECSTLTVVYLSHAMHCKLKSEVCKALLFLGDTFVAENEDPAMTLYTLALEGFTFMDIHQYRAECMLRLGDLAHKHRDWNKARTFWSQARPLFEQAAQTKSVAEVDSRLVCLKDPVINQQALGKLVNLQVPVQIVSTSIKKSGVDMDNEVPIAVE
ncbi:ATPase-AAA-core domain-containing protein [Favolaschia claudopus]|uniref:ATPase-AAA-core domain-containing protein n=1 Tax=Favolaschia claudopus TaxID=2862362 RepID=A0AAW0CVE7_9AGAR